MTMTDSMTAACAEWDRVIFARNREIAERDAEIERLRSDNALLEAVYVAVKDWPEGEQTMALRYALADLENKR